MLCFSAPDQPAGKLSMDYLPIFLNIENRPCLVIGGGEVAARKVGLLLDAGGRVTVVAPELCEALRARAEAGEIQHQQSGHDQARLENSALIIAATSDPEANREVAARARELNIPVNVVDDPQDGSFIMPSIIDRSPVVAAVSTGGASPVLARLIRARLESLIPAGYGRLAELTSRFREKVKRTLANPDDRRRFWDRILQGSVAERVFSGHMEEAEAVLEKELAEFSPSGGMGAWVRSTWLGAAQETPTCSPSAPCG